MDNPDDRLKTTPGLLKGEFVPLTVSEFREAYATIVQALTGGLPHDPTFPAAIANAETGQPVSFPDTPFNRGWYAAGKGFDDDARRTSFYWRVNKVMPLTKDPKYRNYVGQDGATIHVALLGAVAAVPFSTRTTPEALHAALDAEFRRRLATAVDTGEQRH
jgi:hypothetical protein